MDKRLSVCVKLLLIAVMARVAMVLFLGKLMGADCSSQSGDLDCEMLIFKRKVFQVCNKRNTTEKPDSDNFDRIHIYNESKVYWCPVYKASTTTWMRYMFDTTRSISQVSMQTNLAGKIWKPNYPIIE